MNRARRDRRIDPDGLDGVFRVRAAPNLAHATVLVVDTVPVGEPDLPADRTIDLVDPGEGMDEAAPTGETFVYRELAEARTAADADADDLEIDTQQSVRIELDAIEVLQRPEDAPDLDALDAADDPDTYDEPELVDPEMVEPIELVEPNGLASKHGFDEMPHHLQPEELLETTDDMTDDMVELGPDGARFADRTDPFGSGPHSGPVEIGDAVLIEVDPDGDDDAIAMDLLGARLEPAPPAPAEQVNRDPFGVPIPDATEAPALVEWMPTEIRKPDSSLADATWGPPIDPASVIRDTPPPRRDTPSAVDPDVRRPTLVPDGGGIPIRASGPPPVMRLGSSPTDGAPTPPTTPSRVATPGRGPRGSTPPPQSPWSTPSGPPAPPATQPGASSKAPPGTAPATPSAAANAAPPSPRRATPTPSPAPPREPPPISPPLYPPPPPPSAALPRRPPAPSGPSSVVFPTGAPVRSTPPEPPRWASGTVTQSTEAVPGWTRALAGASGWNQARPSLVPGWAGAELAEADDEDPSGPFASSDSELGLHGLGLGRAAPSPNRQRGLTPRPPPSSSGPVDPLEAPTLPTQPGGVRPRPGAPSPGPMPVRTGDRPLGAAERAQSGPPLTPAPPASRPPSSIPSATAELGPGPRSRISAPTGPSAPERVPGLQPPGLQPPGLAADGGSPTEPRMSAFAALAARQRESESTAPSPSVGLAKPYHSLPPAVYVAPAPVDPYGLDPFAMQLHAAEHEPQPVLVDVGPEIRAREGSSRAWAMATLGGIVLFAISVTLSATIAGAGVGYTLTRARATGGLDPTQPPAGDAVPFDQGAQARPGPEGEPIAVHVRDRLPDSVELAEVLRRLQGCSGQVQVTADGDLAGAEGSGLDAARSVEMRLRALGFTDVAVAVRAEPEPAGGDAVRVTVACRDAR